MIKIRERKIKPLSQEKSFQMAFGHPGANCGDPSTHPLCRVDSPRTYRPGGNTRLRVLVPGSLPQF